MKKSHAFGLLLAAFVTQVSANVTFNYIGNEFTSGPGGSPILEPAFGTRITASITFDDTVTADFTGQVVGAGPQGVVPHVISYEISSGPLLLASTIPGSHDAFGIDFQFINGQVFAWLLGIQSNDFLTVLETYSNGEGSLMIDLATNNFINSNDGIYNSTRNPGTWSRQAPVPLPPSVALLPTALALTWFGTRRGARDKT